MGAIAPIDCLQSPATQKDPTHEGEDSPETWKTFYATIEEVSELSSPEPPLHYSASAEEFLADLEEDDVILCMDGGECRGDKARREG